MIEFALLAEDKQVVAYRPRLNKVIRSVEATILFQQIFHYWYYQGEGMEPFYKFIAPCGHSDYREGDSWTERLAMTRYSIEKALDIIATKITQGVSKNEAFEQTDIKHLVIWWTDSSKKSWFCINPKAAGNLLIKAYPEKINKFVAIRDVHDSLGNSDGHDYLSNSEGQNCLGNSEGHDYIYTENTTENTTENSNNEIITEPKVPELSDHPVVTKKGRRVRFIEGGYVDRKFGEEARAAFDDWMVVTERTGRRIEFGGKRRDNILARLKGGATLDDIKLAVRGILHDKFHMGWNSTKSVIDDLKYICEEPSTLEKFRDLAIQKGIKPDAELRKSNFVRGNVSAAKKSDSGPPVGTRRI